MFCVFISLEENSGRTLNMKTMLLVLLISIFLFITYPSFVLFVVIYLIYFFSVNVKMIMTSFITLSLKKKSSVLCLLSITFLGLTYFVIRSTLFESLLQMIKSPSEDWRIPPTFLYDWRFGFFIFLGATIAILLICKRKKSISFFYLILFIPIVLSLNEALFPYVVYLLPVRSILLITCLSWVLLPILLDVIFHKGSTEKGMSYLILGRRKSRRIKMRSLTSFFVLVLFISQVIPTLTPHFSLMQARDQYADWFTNQEGFTSNFEALEWIDENISPEDLILNDLAYSSLYLSSFSKKNMAFVYQAYWTNPSEQILDFSQVWRYPKNSTFLKMIIEKYDVKYIFVSSEPRFYDFIFSKKDVVEYTHKFYTPFEYITIFNNYLFIAPIFRRGESVIYRISS